jgi:inner membrane protein involved in colicin E2 resistance
MEDYALLAGAALLLAATAALMFATRRLGGPPLPVVQPKEATA